MFRHSQGVVQPQATEDTRVAIDLRSAEPGWPQQKGCPHPQGAAPQGRHRGPLAMRLIPSTVPDKASTKPGPESIQQAQAGAKGTRARGMAGDQATAWVQNHPSGAPAKDRAQDKPQCASKGPPQKGITCTAWLVSILEAQPEWG